MQHGNYQRIQSTFSSDESSWMVISDDQKQAIATIVRKYKETSSKRPRYKFKGLNEDWTYEVLIRQQSNDLKPLPSFRLSGRLLNQYGLDLGDFFLSSDRKENSNSIDSRMFVINAVL